MKYMGSKARHAKEIIPIILKNRKPEQWYVEPFVGGANVIDKLSGPRIGNDSNYYLIKLLESLRDGWQPPLSMDEDEYKDIKNNKELYPPELVGFAGIPCSYAGKWFGGYCRGNRKDGSPRDYVKEGRDNCLNQSPNLKGIQFTCNDYRSMSIPNSSVIYCDPPYAKTVGYKQVFDSQPFWDWCDSLIDKGHIVFVSEYNAPAHWNVVWEKHVNSSLTKETGSKKATEKLFTRGISHDYPF